MSGKHCKPPWWRRSRGGGHRAPGPRRYLTEMVDGADGWAHLLTPEAIEQGLREGTGCYRVLCGRQITAASLAARPSGYCQSCVVLKPMLRWGLG